MVIASGSQRAGQDVSRESDSEISDALSRQDILHEITTEQVHLPGRAVPGPAFTSSSVNTDHPWRNLNQKGR
jgi:hypothetical protein